MTKFLVDYFRSTKSGTSLAKETQQQIENSQISIIQNPNHRLHRVTVNDLIKTLKKTPNEFKSVLLINHEPSLTELVKKICFESKSIMMRSLIEKFSTCAVAEIFFNFESWNKIAELKGELINFTKPKQLQASRE